VFLTDPSLVPPMFPSVFMEKLVGFVKNYVPVFMLGAVFGKYRAVGFFQVDRRRPSLAARPGARSISIVVVCAILTYGGVSLFRRCVRGLPVCGRNVPTGDIPKRLIPCTIALGAFSFTMDALPGTPQSEHHSYDVLQYDDVAAPVLGLVGSVFVFGVGFAILRTRGAAQKRRRLRYRILNEPEPFEEKALPNPWIAIPPLVVVGVANFVLTHLVPRAYGAKARSHTRRSFDRYGRLSGGSHMGSRGRSAPWYSDGVSSLLASGGLQIRRWQQGSRRRALLASLNTRRVWIRWVIAAVAALRRFSAALRAIPIRLSMKPSP